MILIICFSCEENFSPRTEFKERYVINCIIRGDTAFQSATVSRSYNVEGYDPYTNNASPFLKVKDIRLWSNNIVYVFKDSLSYDANPRYKEPIPFYYLNNFKPTRGHGMMLRVVVDDYRIYWAYTWLPDSVKWDSYNSDLSIADDNKEVWKYFWSYSVYGTWFLPKLYIVYSHVNDEPGVRRVQEVYKDFIIIDNTSVPQPFNPIKTPVLSVKKRNIDSAMVNISRDDPNKKHYIIHAAFLDLLIFDEHLSKYFSSSRGYLDDYTIRVDESDYTNIEGGYGIFGSYLKQSKQIRIQTEYVEKFGYTAGNP